MSKSLGNYIGVTEPASEMFGKLMSISDELMARYYAILLRRELPNEAHPLEAKKQLAVAIVQMYHGPEAGRAALQEWTTRFSDKRLSDVDLPAFGATSGDIVGTVVSAYAKGFDLVKSRSEVTRLIKQGSVQVDGAKIVDPKAHISLRSGQILRLDKTHAVRIA
jgi:tyrosyl-tRNA synthetase